VRTSPGTAAGKRPDLDGPGSFGRLQDTVTLGCLTYLGTIGNDKTLQALVRDDRGEIHRMRVGDYMGENSGVIRKIEEGAITIEQITMNGAQPVTRTVTLKRAAP
jgi:type IV pilus assembly protein PilP